jgi:hypothetical protein
MRRWVLSAGLCALLALPVWGQRGGGGHGGMGGGGHAFSGGGGGYAAHGSAGYGYHGPVGGYRAPSYSGAYRTPGYAGAYRAPYWNNSYRGYSNGYRYPYPWGGRGYGYGWSWRGYPYRWGWGYPYWGLSWGGGWWPGWGLGWGAGWDWGAWDNSFDYSSDSYAAANYQANNYQAQPYVYATPDYGYSPDGQTQDEISNLRSEVDQLRAQQENANQARAQIHAQTVLVYRDGHTEEVENYAIVGKTIWIFNESHARKVPLTDLNLDATKRDNDDRGIEFVVPTSR